MSEIERLILSRDFPYLQPYFYNHPWALRCALGAGNSKSAFRRRAWARLREICQSLFPVSADAVIFNYWMTDYSTTGGPWEQEPGQDAEAVAFVLKTEINQETRMLRFLETMQSRYRHVTVRNLATYAEPGSPETGTLRHRVVCYPDDRGFDDWALLRRQMTEEEDTGLDISLVSFANECILSVYDDRGCDVVFAVPEKLAEFYPRLEPYFLAWDAEEMRRRLVRSKQ